MRIKLYIKDSLTRPTRTHISSTLVPIRAVVDPASDRGGAFFAHLVTATRLGPQKVHTYHSETHYCFISQAYQVYAELFITFILYSTPASFNLHSDQPVYTTLVPSTRLQSIQPVYTRAPDQTTVSSTGHTATQGVHHPGITLCRIYRAHWYQFER